MPVQTKKKVRIISFDTSKMHDQGITAPPPAQLFFFHFCPFGGFLLAVGSPDIQLLQGITKKL